MDTTWPFRKVLTQTKKKGDSVNFACLCDPEACTYTTFHFKTLLKHLKTSHAFVIQPGQLCYECHLMFQRPCEVLAHYHMHLRSRLDFFGMFANQRLCPPCALHRNFFDKLAQPQHEECAKACCLAGPEWSERAANEINEATP